MQLELEGHALTVEKLAQDGCYSDTTARLSSDRMDCVRRAPDGIETPDTLGSNS